MVLTRQPIVFSFYIAPNSCHKDSHHEKNRQEKKGKNDATAQPWHRGPGTAVAQKTWTSRGTEDLAQPWRWLLFFKTLT